MDSYKFNDQNRPLEPEKFYHIYNRGNQQNAIFFSEENYRYFLSKYTQYLSGYVDTYAYCLMENHFHFLLRVKSKKDILEYAKHGFQNLTNSNILLPNKIVSEQFRRFFLSYAKAINKQNQLTGSLFQKYFRRKLIDNDLYYTRLIYYIHANPSHHGIVDDFKTYPWSSFTPLLNGPASMLQRQDVLSFFNGMDGYREFHNRKLDFKEIDYLLIED
ncbi:MAG: hypothetical protein WDA22_16380 [Bacteroidota bacterium]|jgi:REP element-mobilizing transposase RayT